MCTRFFSPSSSCFAVRLIRYWFSLPITKTARAYIYYTRTVVTVVVDDFSIRPAAVRQYQVPSDFPSRDDDIAVYGRRQDVLLGWFLLIAFSRRGVRQQQTQGSYIMCRVGLYSYLSLLLLLLYVRFFLENTILMRAVCILAYTHTRIFIYNIYVWNAVWAPRSTRNLLAPVRMHRRQDLVSYSKLDAGRCRYARVRKIYCTRLYCTLKSVSRADFYIFYLPHTTTPCKCDNIFNYDRIDARIASHTRADFIKDLVRRN